MPMHSSLSQTPCNIVQASLLNPVFREEGIPECHTDVHNLLLLSLLLQIGLHSPLPGLALSMLGLPLLLFTLIPRQPRYCTSDSASNPISDSLAQILDLALSFLALAFLVLANTFLPQAFGTNQIPNCFLTSTNGLVPGSLGAVGGVFGDATGGVDGEGTGFGGRMGEVMLGVGFGLLVFGDTLGSWLVGCS